MDSHTTPEVSSEVAQFLNLTLVECRAILKQYQTQEEREVNRIKEKYESDSIHNQIICFNKLIKLYFQVPRDETADKDAHGRIKS